MGGEPVDGADELAVTLEPKQCGPGVDSVGEHVAVRWWVLGERLRRAVHAGVVQLAARQHETARCEVGLRSPDRLEHSVDDGPIGVRAEAVRRHVVEAIAGVAADTGVGGGRGEHDVAGVVQGLVELSEDGLADVAEEHADVRDHIDEALVGGAVDEHEGARPLSEVDSG